MTLADILPTLGSSLTRRLDKPLWPSTARRHRDGEFMIGGVRLSRLAADYGTAVHVLDEADVRASAAEYAAGFGPGGSAYSAKAGLTMVSGRWIAEAGLGCYVGSAGQLRTALAAGFRPDSLVLSGPAKSVAALDAAFACGASVVVGSVAEAVTLSRRAPAGQRVLVRGITAVQGQPPRSRYGLRLGSSPALQTVATVLAAGNLRLAGVDCSLGHRLARFGTFEQCLREAIAFSAVIRARHGVSIGLINLGGGQALSCRDGGEGIPVGVFADRMRGVARVNADRYGMAPPLVRVSPGRALVARAGITVHRVRAVTRGSYGRLLVEVDGPLSSGMEPAGEPPAELVSRASRAPREVAVLTCGEGPQTTVSVPGDVEAGDLLAVPGTGACQQSGEPLVGRPAVVAVAGGLTRTLVRRVSVADMLRRAQ
ncbi:diaminopimelate decarboxylase family protein [Actinoplanes couchii]|uniref:Diaminopimelate decarboxylase n=1 Tax=Actinoplanes couchii TaxID=403638 RepID=A0ABQ3XTF8_9ACTN|nr:hypothetical protein [Actinoplanes couchii]MDR6318697.1 diaminopimelate decarboxylase [Actinoplanes couchii]GID61796.1 diaminopimelate decarboxylase [Actinoplanes couchii]